ncbi:MAG: MBL fold metallo-hydrolase [Bacteroidales bacterium]|nr:MBL fold metallo-hydrolase [Bacteroidales bacterium]
MKRPFKILLRWLLGIVLFVIVLSVLYMIVFRSTLRKMTPAETARLTEDVYAIRDKYVNMYLFRDGNDFIAIDAGIKPGTIETQMKKLDIDPGRIKAVFLTHTDTDHAGGVSLFKNAVVYLHEDEEQMINGETGRVMWIGNKLSVPDYKLLDDKVIIIGDLRIDPVPVPGHTTGLTCYRVNDIYLFTGDAVSLQSGAIGLFPGYINKNSRKARMSVDNITGLEGVQYLFTGHHGYSSDYNSAVRGFEK